MNKNQIKQSHITQFTLLKESLQSIKKQHIKTLFTSYCTPKTIYSPQQGESNTNDAFIEDIKKDLPNNLIRCLKVDTQSVQLDKFVKELPKETFTSLLYLDFIDRTQTRQECQQIRTWVQNLQYFQQLQYLSLSIGHHGNNFNKKGCTLLANSLKKLKNLKYLILYFDSNHIETADAQLIGNSLAHMVDLEYLELFFDFGGNTIQKDGCKAIGNSIKNMKKLKTLNLKFGSFNRIQAEGLEFLGEGIKEITALKNLQLQIIGNQIDPLGAKNIKSILESQPKLEKLEMELSNTYILTEGAQYLGEGFKALQNLKVLDLNINNDNNIYEEGAQHIAEGITYLRNLEKFNILVTNLNNIQEKGANMIREAVIGLPKCTDYNLNFELLYSDDGEKFQSFIVKKKKKTGCGCTIF